MSPRRVIVVGGGPAGLTAAGRAAERGADVLLLEKMKRPGRKLLLTGHGRCNLTNSDELADFMHAFGSGGKFLRQALDEFSAPDLIALMGTLGVATMTAPNGRVYPESERSLDVLDALLRWVRRKKVTIQPESPVSRLLVTGSQTAGVLAEKEYGADAVVLATGGMSYPGTGSTGDGYRLLRQVGHTIVRVRPSLVSLTTAGRTAGRLQGISLTGVRATATFADHSHLARTGDLLFTHFGLTGPVILSLSRQLVPKLEAGETVHLSLDLAPARDHGELDRHLQRQIANHPRQLIKSLLAEYVPGKGAEIACAWLNLEPNKPRHQLTASERKHIRLWLKDFTFDITGHRGFDDAVVTAGGVSLKEIDPRTLMSRKVSGLFVAGELLDLDGDTGGYNLQAAFSTGWLAGQSAAEFTPQS